MSKKKHKNDDFCGMSAEEQKRQMLAFEGAFTSGTVGELLDDIENTDDDDRLGDMLLKDTLGKILDGEDDGPEYEDDDAESLFPEFDGDDDCDMEPIPYAQIDGEYTVPVLETDRPNLNKRIYPSTHETRPLPRFFDIDFIPGTTLIKITDGLKTCTIDYNGLDKKPWDGERIAKHLSRTEVNETSMFITEIQLLLPNFYPSYIGTKDTIRGIMSNIKSFNEDRFIFFTRNFITTDVPHSELIVGYDIPEQSAENILGVAEFLIDNNLHTSFIETLYGIVTMGGFSTNSLNENSLMGIWSTGTFVDSNEAFVEQLLEDGDTERIDDDGYPVTLIAYDECQDGTSNYSFMRYVDEAYSPIFAILFDSEADFSEIDELLDDSSDAMDAKEFNKIYKVDNPEKPSEEFIDDDDSDDDDDDYIAPNEVVPTGDIEEDEDNPEDLFDDDDTDTDEDDGENAVEMEVKKVPGPQPDEMIVSKESGIGFNAKKNISDMTNEEIEEKYGDEYSDMIEKGNRPAPRQSMKKQNRFDDGDMVVKRR